MKRLNTHCSVRILALWGLAISLMAGLIFSPLPLPQMMEGVRHFSLTKKYLRVNQQMTLREVEKETGVPVDVLIDELRLPANVSLDSPLRKLSKTYKFDLEKVHSIVDQYEESSRLP